MRLTKAQWEVLFILNPKSGKRPWMTAAQIAAKRAGAAKARANGTAASYANKTFYVLDRAAVNEVCAHRCRASVGWTTCQFRSTASGADLVRKRRERQARA